MSKRKAAYSRLSINVVQVMMVIQNSLPSSIEAALSFISDNGKQDLLCDWKCPNCDKHPQGRCGKTVPVTERSSSNCDSCALNFPRSQLSTVSTMSGGSKPTFVYHRRKLQGISDVFPAQASANTKPSDNCLSAISSEAPSMAAKEHVRGPVMLPVECNKGALVSKSGSIDGCSPGSVEDPKGKMRKVVDVCCINDSYSSSKSNMDLCLDSLDTEVDDTGECSSSGALLMEGLKYDLSEKDICISILRSQGLLERVLPTKIRASSDVMGVSSDSSCFRPCKVCDQLDTTLKMLICDHCDEAFHVSCCNPRIKKIVVDEWFCHSCLKKKRKILKETITSKSQNISSDMGRSRNAASKCALGPISLMLQDTEPYTSNVRVGKDFQAEVPDWSGSTVDEVDSIGEPLEMNLSECYSFKDWSSSKPSRLSPIGNWVQCREVIDGVGEGVDGTICGKWRRAPLFEVQTDDWECFRSVLWDPTHSDCAVPQELDTEQVLKHLKYIEMLRPRLAAKRRKFDRTKSVDSQDNSEDVKNTQTT